MMRMVLVVALATAGIGLVGAPQAPAAPVNAAVIGDLAVDHVTPVRWWWGHRGYYHRRWGYGYRHYWRRW